MNIFVILMALGHGVLLGTGVIAIWAWTDEHFDKIRFRKKLDQLASDAITQEIRERRFDIEHWHKTKSLREAADICEAMYKAIHPEAEK